MRNARNLRFRFLIMFLLFIPMMYALPPEGITIKGKVTDETLKEGAQNAIKRFVIVQEATFEVVGKYVYIH